MHSLGYRGLNEGYLSAEHVRGFLAEYGFFPHQAKECVAGDVYYHRVGYSKGGKAVFAARERCRQAQQRARWKYPIQSRGVRDTKTYFALTDEENPEILVAGAKQDTVGLDMLLLTERLEGTLQS